MLRQGGQTEERKSRQRTVTKDQSGRVDFNAQLIGTAFILLVMERTGFSSRLLIYTISKVEFTLSSIYSTSFDKCIQPV